MALYGHEIDETTTPFEAGLAWVVKLDKGDFLGREALAGAEGRGGRPASSWASRCRGGESRARGTRLSRRAAPVGVVTSGTWSPTFEKALGLAYVPPAMAAPGTPLAIDVRGKDAAGDRGGDPVL